MIEEGEGEGLRPRPAFDAPRRATILCQLPATLSRIPADFGVSVPPSSN